MKQSQYNSYDDLPLFLNADMVAKVLGVSSSTSYELMHDVHRRLMQKIDDSMRVLNDDGKQEAVKRVEELTEIPKYQLHHDPDEK